MEDFYGVENYEFSVYYCFNFNFVCFFIVVIWGFKGKLWKGEREVGEYGFRGIISFGRLMILLIIFNV